MKIIRHGILLALLSLSGPGLLFAADAININTADKEALMELNGVGEKLAQAIIDYRKEHGHFGSADDLTKVHGIGPAVVNKNRERLSADKPQ